MREVLNYEVACLQTRSRAVSLEEGQKDKDIRANIGRIGEMIDYITAFGNSDVRLVALPEYAINARWQKMELEDWFRLCTTIPGPYTDLLAEKAKQRNIYIGANMLEIHSDFPQRFFNTSFLIGPTGEILIKHWKNNNNACVFPYTTPSRRTIGFIPPVGARPDGRSSAYS